MKTVACTLVLVCLIAATGCGRPYQTEADRFVNLSGGGGYDRGLVVCLSGAGGMAGEVDRICQGLVAGNVGCAIESFEWSTGWLLVDQADMDSNKQKAAMLARRIARYHGDHPDCPVHLIGVSAGTGLVVWALEDLPQDVRVENAFLVASSVWSGYDLTGALRRVGGHLYNHYSAVDMVLALGVPATGTVDRKAGPSGGLAGFQPPANAGDEVRALYTDRLSQVQWKGEDMALGHGGDHLGGTQPAYVKERIAALAWSRPAPADTVASGPPAPAPAAAAPVVESAAIAPAGEPSATAPAGESAAAAPAAEPAVAVAAADGK
jgi:pimeloyl-ACP methyl ester carboxylesterase